MKTTSNAAAPSQGEALPDDTPNDLPKVGGTFHRIGGRLVPEAELAPTLSTPTAVPAADRDPPKED